MLPGIKSDLTPELEKMLSAYKLLDRERALAIMPFWFALE
jgi:hypothetical protein